jgi:putative membrane protein (TIGR04086 family)
MKVFPLFRGCFISLIIAFSLTLIIALINYFGHIEQGVLTKLLILVNYISIGIGGLIAAVNVDNKGWLYGGFVGLIYALLFWLLIHFVPGLYVLLSFISIFQALVVSFLVGTVGGIIGVNL